MKNIKHKVDFCVVGGGLAGLCAAVSAARNGVKTALVQDRPVLGGNSSSEIRMWVCGAHGKDNRETGIIEEIILENFYQNTGLKYSVWDSVLYEKARFEENILLLLNTSCFDAVVEDGRISSIRCWQTCAETFHTIEAEYFADCSGDSVLAPLTGAEFMYGREAKSEFSETIPPDKADSKTMGMSCLFQIRETPSKKTFVPPEWAYVYETDEDLPYKDHELTNNFWWIELGGDGDCIHDTDKYRDELLKIAYGVWDHIKNRGDHGADNWELEWIGFLPGKRESRRYVGEHVVTQNDVEAAGRFDDVVAYAGWTMDDHFPEGFNYKDGHPTIYHPAPSPWGIPYRSLYSKNIKNLFFAGRNISVTHAALSSCRVMATCAILGQAVGTAVALACNNHLLPKEVDVHALQQRLLFDDCFIPFIKREISPICAGAELSHSMVRGGICRGEKNLTRVDYGEEICYRFKRPEHINGVRIVFDSDLNRGYHNMPCCYPLDEKNYKLPKTLVRDFEVIYTTADGVSEILSVKNNRKRFVKLSVAKDVAEIKLKPLSGWGCEKAGIFAFEVF